MDTRPENETSVIRIWELTGVPYTSAAQPGGIAKAIAALREAGLADRLTALDVEDAGDLGLEAPSGLRGPSGLLNEMALGRLVEASRERVRATRRRGNRALLVGGDCPVLLGALAALGDADDQPGLVMLDGHEDAWPPGRSSTGEVSDSELGIALGLVGEALPPPLDELVPLVHPSGVALLGPRDGAEIEAGGVDSVRDEVAYFADADAIGNEDVAATMAVALEAIDATALWLHIDLDALATEALPAVDYPQPGGLHWHELDRLAALTVADPRCCGVSVGIYNPERDPDGTGAGLVVDFVCRLVG
jgi:arginase